MENPSDTTNSQHPGIPDNLYNQFEFERIYDNKRQSTNNWSRRADLHFPEAVTLY